MSTGATRVHYDNRDLRIDSQLSVKQPRTHRASFTNVNIFGKTHKNSDNGNPRRRRSLQTSGAEETDHAVPSREYLRRVHDRLGHLRLSIWRSSQRSLRRHGVGHVGLLRHLQHGGGALLRRVGDDHYALRGRVHVHPARIRTLPGLHLPLDDVHLGTGCHDDGVFAHLRHLHPDARLPGLRAA